MRSKAPLALIEQAIMLLVFALAAVLCLRAFVWADKQSEGNSARDHAVVYAQTGAETLKYYRGNYEAAAQEIGGDWDGISWEIGYDGQWNQTTDNERYLLRVVPEQNGRKYLESARVEVWMNDAELVQLPVSWQEVTANEW